jgi:hypothetical protein
MNRLNFNLFATPLSPEAKYWLGFILADGYLCRNKLNIKLHFRDKEHLQKLLALLGSKSKVYILEDVQTTFGVTTSALLSIKSQRLVDQLLQLGIEYRKSLTATPLVNLEYDVDFWRGVIDGDGSLRIRSGIYVYAEIAICGTESIVQGFADFAKIVAPTPHTPKITKRKSTHFGFAVGGSRASKIVSLQYYPHCLSLDRKQIIADKIKEVSINEYRRLGSKD